MTGPAGRGPSAAVSPGARGPVRTRAAGGAGTASADRTGHTNGQADRTDLEAAARTVHARLTEAGTPLNRQTLTEALRRDGHSLSNAAAGQLLAVLRADRPSNSAGPNPSADGADQASSG